jgi:type IV pilus assembly protein PilM
VRAAGLSVAAVDLVPLALVRSVGRRVSDNGGGVEAIVSIGGGVTVVVVHELGIPRFVRILGSGGRSVTDAIARDLELSTDQAEAVKRQMNTAPPDLAQRAQRAMARPISDLVEQIRGSLDYYRTQPDSIRLLRVTLTGGGALTPGLVEQLVDTVGVPVDPASPRDHIAIGDIGFPDEQLPLLDPFLPVPVGLALGGLLSGKRIDLLGARTREPVDRQQLLVWGGIAAAILLVLLGGLYFLKNKQVDDERDKLAAAEAQNRELESKIADLSDVSQRQAQIEQLSQQTQALLSTDVAWSQVLQAISRTIPSDVWLTSFQGTVASASSGTSSGTTAPATGTGTTAPTTAGPTGPVTFAAVGTSFDAVAAWIRRMGTDVPYFTGLWVPSAARGGSSSSSSASTSSANTENVTFSSTATLTEKAQSNRADQFKVTP